MIMDPKLLTSILTTVVPVPGDLNFDAVVATI